MRLLPIGMMDSESASTSSEISRTSSELSLTDQCIELCLTSPSLSQSASESNGCNSLSDDLVCSNDRESEDHVFE